MKMKKLKTAKFKVAKVNAVCAGAPTRARADAYGASGKKRVEAFTKRFKR